MTTGMRRRIAASIVPRIERFHSRQLSANPPEPQTTSKSVLLRASMKTLKSVRRPFPSRKPSLKRINNSSRRWPMKSDGSVSSRSIEGKPTSARTGDIVLIKSYPPPNIRSRHGVMASRPGNNAPDSRETRSGLRFEQSGHRLNSRSTATCNMATSPMFLYSAAPVFKPVTTITHLQFISYGGVRVRNALHARRAMQRNWTA